MELIWLEDYFALAEILNFSRAADLRHVTQPAFSRRIKAVESWVGAALFSRTWPADDLHQNNGVPSATQ
jgi:LysR family transcriptional regulator, hypochlorite-specific transcription factor HypT